MKSNTLIDYKEDKKSESFQKGAQPFEALGVSLLLGHAAHKHLDRSGTLIPLVSRFNSQSLSQLIFRDCSSFIDLISQNYDGNLL